jgi:hypothetical protein
MTVGGDGDGGHEGLDLSVVAHRPAAPALDAGQHALDDLPVDGRIKVEPVLITVTSLR